MTELTDPAARLGAIRERIAAACTRAGRSADEVTLVAVSKGHDIAAIEAMAALGVDDFGESYVQEWQRKAAHVENVRWHFIGHLQSNKAKFIVDHVALIHSVDRASLMKALARRSDHPVDILLQINVGEDPAKFGADPGAVTATLEKALSYEGLRVRGLMTIPPFGDDPEDSRPHFRALHAAFEGCRDWLSARAPERLADFCELSMGMSDDFEVAIEEGATLIRVGTALFGPRSYT